MNGELMSAEIREQPAVLARILCEGGSTIGSVARAIAARHPRFVLFAARGTSDHAALYAKYLVETRLGLPAGLVSPSTTTVYGARPDMRDVLFIAVSQSGSSPDLIEPLQAARAGGAITLAITNTAGSPLASAAEYSLDVLAGLEQAVAATKTYTAELLTLYLLVMRLAGQDDESAHTLPERAERQLAREDEVARLAARYRFADQLVVTARGYNYATARETALKLMETAYLVAHAFSAADLLHGPVAMIDRGFPVLAIVPSGGGGQAVVPVIAELRERAADVCVIGNAEAVRAGGRGLELVEAESEELSPLLAILPLQQLAWHLARERGQDPDAPRGLRKVTLTR